MYIHIYIDITICTYVVVCVQVRRVDVEPTLSGYLLLGERDESEGFCPI